jgi:SagB-type dehydrogenase family enzyme
MTWREYHEQTKHSLESLRRGGHTLDWTNTPDPFRHYQGVPVLDLPADPPSADVAALDVLFSAAHSKAPADGSRLISQLLFYSAAISAAKRVQSTGYKYALRVNPSSGNLHPTEFHFVACGVKDWPDGVYHYRPSSHMAEQRAAGCLKLPLEGEGTPLVFILTSIAWREAWKYRNRAYRYCLHDIGHAWQALALSAHAAGCRSFAWGRFPDDELARVCRFADDEWPMILVALEGGSIGGRAHTEDEVLWYGGEPNRLSERVVSYPLIDQIHGATKRLEDSASPTSSTSSGYSLGPASGGLIALPEPAHSVRPFGEVVRSRRSALDFRGGSWSMSLPQLSAILAASFAPLAADFATARFISLYLYAHRIEGLQPGVYRYWPYDDGLEILKLGDQRVMAAGLSLGQDLAGNACVAFSMIGDLDRATQIFGDRGYRYVHFEAGAIGQRLYLAAEALGLGATGIGAFFDDEVHEYLGLGPGDGQAVYHFAIGYPAPDPRLDA